jgi:hypothetical protein
MSDVMTVESPAPARSEVKEPEEKPCRMCAFPMPFHAHKCTKCDAFSGWRRLLPVSATVLSLLIALFSVVGIVLPKIIDTLNAGSSVTVRVVGDRQAQDQQPGVILVSAANTGRQPGLVQSARLDLSSVGVKSPVLEIRNREAVEECGFWGGRSMVSREDEAFAGTLIRSWVLSRLPGKKEDQIGLCPEH